MAKPKNSSPSKANSMDVLAWMAKRKVTSTKEIADRFKIRLSQATANVAILRIKKAIERVETPADSNDQSSRWVCL